MGNENAMTGVAAGIAATLLVGGITLLHDSDTRTESNEQREVDIKSAIETEVKEEVRFADLSEKVRNIQQNVAHSVPHRLPQPLVLASDIFDQQFDFAATATVSTANECNRPVLIVTNLGDYAALDVSVVWIIQGHPITVAVPHKALRVNEEITSAIVPKLKPKTKVDGYLQIEYGDSTGFRGVVKHPVSIRTCEGHMHLTIEPHSSQTWLPSASVIHTN